MTQTIDLPFRSLKYDSIGQAVGPNDAAFDGVSGRAGGAAGNTFNQDEANPNTGTFYLQKPGEGGTNAIQLKMGGVHFKLRIATTSGDPVTPAMNPTIEAYSVTMEPWGVSGHTLVGSTWTYADGIFSVVLADGATSVHGYSFIIGTSEWETSPTQQPDLITTSLWTTNAGPNYSLWGAREEPYDAVVYWGIFRIEITQDCTSGHPSIIDPGMYRSDDTLHNKLKSVGWSYPYRLFYLTFEEAANLDPNGYWVTYSCTNSIEQQYPKRRHRTGVDRDWGDAADLIPVGTYTDEMALWKVTYVFEQANPGAVAIVQNDPPDGTCGTLDGGDPWIRNMARVSAAESSWFPNCCSIYNLVYRLDQPGQVEAGPWHKYVIVKSSVPYRIKYTPYLYPTIGGVPQMATYQYPHNGVCDQRNALATLTTDQGSVMKVRNQGAIDPPIGYLIETFEGNCTEETHFVATTFLVAENAATFVFSHTLTGYVTALVWHD